MNTNIIWLDVTENLREGNQPVFMHERPLVHGNKPKGGLFNTAEVARTGEFWVPTTPVLDIDEIQWSKTACERYVRVPLHAYRTRDRALASVFVAGLEIGTRAMASLALRYKQEPQDITLIVGHECTDLISQGVSQFRCYVGLAIRTK